MIIILYWLHHLVTSPSYWVHPPVCLVSSGPSVQIETLSQSVSQSAGVCTTGPSCQVNEPVQSWAGDGQVQVQAQAGDDVNQCQCVQLHHWSLDTVTMWPSNEWYMLAMCVGCGVATEAAAEVDNDLQHHADPVPRLLLQSLHINCSCLSGLQPAWPPCRAAVRRFLFS